VLECDGQSSQGDQVKRREDARNPVNGNDFRVSVPVILWDCLAPNAEPDGTAIRTVNRRQNAVELRKWGRWRKKTRKNPHRR
jgi:hypothetical protein